MARQKHSEAKMPWLSKMTSMSQPIFAVPLLGLVSTYQALIIFALGIPSLFITMHITGEIHLGLAPFLIFTIFAMIRPPLISYEGRMIAILSFHLFKGSSKKSKKKSKQKTKGSGFFGKAGATPDITEPAPVQTKPEIMTVQVHGDNLQEISMMLSHRGTPIRRRKVCILLDGDPIKTVISSVSGEVLTILSNDLCVGNRTISIAEISGDTIGETLMSREIKFVRIS